MTVCRFTINKLGVSNCIILIVLCLVHSCYSGLLTGDLKLRSTPLTINHNSPLVVTINGKSKPPLPPLSLPIPEKPPPLLADQLFSPTKPFLSAISPFKVPKLLPILPPIWPPLLPKPPLLPLLPLIPPIPLLPLLPPVLPPVLPPSLLGNKLFPRSLKNPLKPLKVPILGHKTPIEKAVNKVTRKISSDIKKKKVSDKLKKLFKKGSLTSTEFDRFKRKLLNK